ncbi:MAG: hypothetical protein GC168_11350 [Candidatus Hydrogenedens sp.]|nr:hypothetical protein [Candidatus Hydrogenedens sp.]
MIAAAIMLAAGLLGRVEAVAYPYATENERAFICDAEGDGKPEIGFLGGGRLRLTEIGAPGPMIETQLPAQAWAVEPGAAPASDASMPLGGGAGLYVLLSDRLVWMPLGGDPATSLRDVLALPEPLSEPAASPVPFPLLRKTADGIRYQIPSPGGIRLVGSTGEALGETAPPAAPRVAQLQRSAGAHEDSRPAQFVVNRVARFPAAAGVDAAEAVPQRLGTPGQWVSVPDDAPQRWPWMYVRNDAPAPVRAYFHTQPSPEPRTLVRVEQTTAEGLRGLGPVRQYPGFPALPYDGKTMDIDGDGHKDLLVWRARRSMLPGSGALQHWREGAWPVYLEIHRYNPEFGRFEGEAVWRAQEDAPLRWLLQSDPGGPVRHLFCRDMNGDGHLSLGYATSPRHLVIWSTTADGGDLALRDEIAVRSPIDGIEETLQLPNGRTIVLMRSELDAVVLRSTLSDL